jgi:D-arabinose 5-phosphate isomerase GutQ
VKPDGFAADLYRKPEVLRRLAATLEAGNPWQEIVARDVERVVLIGMGSSAYAGGVVAARMRAGGLVATSELASSQLLPAWDARTLVVATSASGGSAETLDALSRLPAGVRTVALTNTAASAITEYCDAVVMLDAEPEVGGVACRSYQHTVSELLLGPAGTHLAAPAHRFCSAQQGALMLREGPRRLAVGCETGDWSHVDVYLTKTTDYRVLVFAGSAWEAQLAEWTQARGSTVVGVGGGVPGARYEIRYAGDADDDVKLLTEVLVPELIAVAAWQTTVGES